MTPKRQNDKKALMTSALFIWQTAAGSLPKAAVCCLHSAAGSEVIKADSWL
jgi:hypothetical protein